MRSSLALAGTAALASAISLDVSGYSRTNLDLAAINAPNDPNCYTYMQHSRYTDVTDKAKFDPARCIRDCEETTAFNAKHLQGRATCRFVNTYIELKNGYPIAQICSMYTASFDRSFAKNTGYTDYKTKDKYTICDSYSYSNITNPGVPGRDCIVQQPQPPVYKPQPPVYKPQPPVYKPQPPVYQTSTLSTVTKPRTTTQPPVYKPTTTTRPTVVIPTTTTQPTIIIPTQPTIIIPTTTTQPTIIIPTQPTVIIPTTTTQPTVIIPTQPTIIIPTTTTSVPVVIPTQAPEASFRCSGLLSVPQCCQTDVLDLASLTCDPPRFDFNTRSEFRSICAEVGTTANCCLLPVLGQALVCQDV